MGEDNKRVTLRDVLNYQPEEYLSEHELQLIRDAFKNHMLLSAVRKIMMPMVIDASLPLESFEQDAFIAGLNWPQIPADEAKILITARQDAIKFIFGGLIKLKILANTKEESTSQKEARLRKDSAK